MNELPDLDRLGHAEKNDLIRALFAQVQALTLTPGSPSVQAKPEPTGLKCQIGVFCCALLLLALKFASA